MLSPHIGCSHCAIRYSSSGGFRCQWKTFVPLTNKEHFQSFVMFSPSYFAGRTFSKVNIFQLKEHSLAVVWILSVWFWLNNQSPRKSLRVMIVLESAQFVASLSSPIIKGTWNIGV